MIDTDLTNKKVMAGLSGGINSMALLCWLANYELKPKQIFIFYADFEEHGDEAFDFVMAGREYAKRKFESVKTKFTINSVLEYFEQEKMIPHPMYSPCSINLKIIPARQWYAEMECDFDLIGFVKEDIRRWKKQTNKPVDLFYNPLYPIIGLTNEDCFDLVKKEIGWYPKHYDIRDKQGKRLFKHYNCLPCKNETEEELKNTALIYPEKMTPALQLAKRLGAYWGRKDIPEELICNHCQL